MNLSKIYYVYDNYNLKLEMAKMNKYNANCTQFV